MNQEAGSRVLVRNLRNALFGPGWLDGKDFNSDYGGTSTDWGAYPEADSLEYVFG